MARNDEKKSIRCSFCGKHQDQVRRLIAGPGAYICNECVQLCMGIVSDDVDLPEEGYAGEIPDEIPESQMKNYGMLTLFKRTHTASLLFWIGFLGNVLRVVFQPLYAYASSVLQSVLHALGRLLSPS